MWLRESACKFYPNLTHPVELKSVFTDICGLLKSILGCGVYYWLWISAVPKLRGYRIRQEVLVLDNGAQSHTLVKVPVQDLAEWDETHDAAGRPTGEVVQETVGVHKVATPEKSENSSV